MPLPRVETFHWTAIEARANELAASGTFRLDPGGRSFVAGDVRVIPPALVPIPDAILGDVAGENETARELAARLARRRRAASAGERDDALLRYARAAPSVLPRQCLILLQAGAAAIGYFDGGEPVATKALKRYVVRGKGRAQPTYLSAKGKSRYGSRLRLQNARRLVDDTNEKLAQYWRDHGAPAEIFVSSPPRLWSDLRRGGTPPPFPETTTIHRIPLDLPPPTTDVLLRAYRTLSYGRIERAE